MTKGAKIALGCGCLLLLASGAAVGMLGFGAFWARSKVHELSASAGNLSAKASQIEELERRASANPYTPPADGVIAEARFLKFLEARKRVYGVYAGYRAEIEQLDKQGKSQERPASVSEALHATGRVAAMFSDVRLAQLQALADLGMNEQEYRDIQLAVYKSAWTAESQKQSGRRPAEATAEATKTAEATAEAMKAVEAPQANVELFRKYEADIRKYAMSGLELLGL